MLTETLSIDHGLLAVWRMRGIGPQALPAEWTKGHRHAYRVDQALSWLAGRRGEPFDHIDAWQSWFTSECGANIADPNELRRQAQLMARAAGPVVGDVTFTPGGWRNYLDSFLTP